MRGGEDAVFHIVLFATRPTASPGHDGVEFKRTQR